jgi:transposase
MDVHYKFSNVTFRDLTGKVARRERLEHPQRDQLRERIARWPKGTPVAMEASFGWGWLSDLLVEAGVNVHLSNCYKVEQMRKARGLVKTNKKDADLTSLLPLEASNWWEVWRAPRDVRDRREQMRFRSDLVALQTTIKNRIHALFHRNGIFHGFSDLFNGKGRVFLADIAINGSAYLTAQTLQTFRGHLLLLEHVRKQLAALLKILKKQLKKTPLISRLQTIDGVGLILSHVLMAEMGDINRFRNHKALASYSLLAPRADDTGEADTDHAPLGRHLGTRGNKTLKWAFIEAAHGAVKHGGKWRATFDRVTNGGKKDRNRGYIKVARELVKIVYVVWKKDVDYIETKPAVRKNFLPSRKEGQGRQISDKSVKSRSGTGQLCEAMVHAAGQ